MSPDPRGPRSLHDSSSPELRATKVCLSSNPRNSSKTASMYLYFKALRCPPLQLEYDGSREGRNADARAKLRRSLGEAQLAEARRGEVQDPLLDDHCSCRRPDRGKQREGGKRRRASVRRAAAGPGRGRGQGRAGILGYRCRGLQSCFYNLRPMVRAKYLTRVTSPATPRHARPRPLPTPPAARTAKRPKQHELRFHSRAGKVHRKGGARRAGFRARGRGGAGPRAGRRSRLDAL